MHPTVRDLIGIGLLIAVLVGLVILLVAGAIPA
jgi:hypothetical protein